MTALQALPFDEVTRPCQHNQGDIEMASTLGFFLILKTRCLFTS
jgi:hypothetical protein